MWIGHEAADSESTQRNCRAPVARGRKRDDHGAAGPVSHEFHSTNGFCSYTLFFERCQHRMACTRCDFYAPKYSTKAQLIEAKDNLQ